MQDETHHASPIMDWISFYGGGAALILAAYFLLSGNLRKSNDAPTTVFKLFVIGLLVAFIVVGFSVVFKGKAETLVRSMGMGVSGISSQVFGFWQWLFGIVTVVLLTGASVFTLLLALWSFYDVNLWDMSMARNRALAVASAAIGIAMCVYYTYKYGPTWMGGGHVDVETRQAAVHYVKQRRGRSA